MDGRNPPEDLEQGNIRIQFNFQKVTGQQERMELTKNGGGQLEVEIRNFHLMENGVKRSGYIDQGGCGITVIGRILLCSCLPT